MIYSILLNKLKKLNIHYYPIIHGCINTRKGKSNFKNFQIILDSRCSSMIVLGRLVQILGPKIYSVIEWPTQVGNITTNLKVEVNFTLPELSATSFGTWKCHVDDSAKGRYDIILGRYLLT